MSDRNIVIARCEAEDKPRPYIPGFLCACWGMGGAVCLGQAVIAASRIG